MQSVSSGRSSEYPENALSETAKIHAGLLTFSSISLSEEEKKADDFVHAYLTRIYSGVMIRFEQKYHVHEYSIVIYKLRSMTSF